jgi:hypothetical protein
MSDRAAIIRNAQSKALAELKRLSADENTSLGTIIREFDSQWNAAHKLKNLEVRNKVLNALRPSRNSIVRIVNENAAKGNREVKALLAPIAKNYALHRSNFLEHSENPHRRTWRGILASRIPLPATLNGLISWHDGQWKRVLNTLKHNSTRRSKALRALHASRNNIVRMIETNKNKPAVQKIISNILKNKNVHLANYESANKAFVTWRAKIAHAHKPPNAPPSPRKLLGPISGAGKNYPSGVPGRNNPSVALLAALAEQGESLFKHYKGPHKGMINRKRT